MANYRVRKPILGIMILSLLLMQGGTAHLLINIGASAQASQGGFCGVYANSPFNAVDFPPVTLGPSQGLIYPDLPWRPTPFAQSSGRIQSTDWYEIPSCLVRVDPAVAVTINGWTGIGLSFYMTSAIPGTGNWPKELNGGLPGDPYYFTAHWEARINVTSNNCTVAMESDDDSWLFVDNTLLIDLGGTHSAISSNATMPPGLHSIDVFYAERADAAELTVADFKLVFSPAAAVTILDPSDISVKKSFEDLLRHQAESTQSFENLLQLLPPLNRTSQLLESLENLTEEQEGLLQSFGGMINQSSLVPSEFISLLESFEDLLHRQYAIKKGFMDMLNQSRLYLSDFPKFLESAEGLLRSDDDLLQSFEGLVGSLFSFRSVVVDQKTYFLESYENLLDNQSQLLGNFGELIGNVGEIPTTKIPTTTVTSLNSSIINLGSSVTDYITISTTQTNYFNAAFGTWTLLAANNSNMNGATTLFTGSLSTNPPFPLPQVEVPSWTPTVAGDYYFQAVYGGDNEYGASTSDIEHLMVVGNVSKIPTATYTSLSSPNVTVGSSIGDFFTFNTTATGPLPPAYGTWTLYWADEPNMNDWLPFVTGGLASFPTPLPRNGGAIWTPYVAGDYYFQAVYSGDGNYSASASGIEHLVVVSNVSKIPTTIDTSLNSSGIITVGSSVTDYITIEPTQPNLLPAFGTWTLYEANNSNMNGATTFRTGALSSQAIPNTYLATWTLTMAGEYYFQAVYSGDGNYSASASNIEHLMVVGNASLIPTATYTSLSSPSVTVGSSITDFFLFNTTANPPLPPATGTWTLYESSESNMNGATPFDNGGLLFPPTPLPINAAGATWTPYVAGEYYFQLVYSGDGNYSASASNIEHLSVLKIPTITQLSLDSTQIPLGGQVQISINISTTATGTLWSRLASGTVDVYEADNPYMHGEVNIGHSILGSYRLPYNNVEIWLPPGGNYFLQAVYSGDDNYGGSSSAIIELDVGDPPGIPSTTVTSLNSSGIITLHSSITDTIRISSAGETDASGNWTLWESNNILMTPETLIGNGTFNQRFFPYTTNVTFTPTSPGLYFFQALYSGNDRYAASSSPIERLWVAGIPTTIDTSLSSRSILNGSSITDTITIDTTSADKTDASGVWTLWESNNNLMTPENLIGQGSFNQSSFPYITSVTFTPTSPGDYYFMAYNLPTDTHSASSSSIEYLNVTGNPTFIPSFKESFEDLLRRQANRIVSFESLLWLLPVQNRTSELLESLENLAEEQEGLLRSFGGMINQSSLVPSEFISLLESFEDLLHRQYVIKRGFMDMLNQSRLYLSDFPKFLESAEHLLRSDAILLENFENLVNSLFSLNYVTVDQKIQFLESYENLLDNQSQLVVEFGELIGDSAADVAVTNVDASATTVLSGDVVNINVSVEDTGDFAETFNVTVYVNSQIIGGQSVSLNSGASANLTFAWNTTGFRKGDYVVSASASIVPNEVNTADNTRFADDIVTIASTIPVTIPGDINDDGKVSLVDLALLANAYETTPASGGTPGTPHAWNPNADIDGNGVVGLSDLVILANHYGQHYP